MVYFSINIYNPAVGVFLSPDNYVQAPDFTQNFNRYAYCLNNPLSFTDPTGNSWLSHLWGWSGEKLSSVDPTKDGTITNKGIAAGIKIGSLGLTILPSSIDAISNGNWSRMDPFYKGTISNNSARITMGLFSGTHQQILSRFTWELPQTIVGFTFSQGDNYLGRVKNVDYFHGATLVNQYGNDIYGMTMGSYILRMGLETSINANSTADEKAGFYTFVHEYGHYVQSQKNGPTYLFKYGLPSLQNMIFDPDYHDYYWVEKDASTRGLAFLNDPTIMVETGFNSSEYLNGFSGGNKYYPGTPIGNTRDATTWDYLGVFFPFRPLVTFFNLW